MLTRTVNPENFVEYLHRRMRIQRASNLGNIGEIPIDKLAQPNIVFHRAISRPTPHEQFKIWNTKRVLNIDKEQTGPKIVSSCRSD